MHFRSDKQGAGDQGSLRNSAGLSARALFLRTSVWTDSWEGGGAGGGASGGPSRGEEGASGLAVALMPGKSSIVRVLPSGSQQKQGGDPSDAEGRPFEPATLSLGLTVYS